MTGNCFKYSYKISPISKVQKSSLVFFALSFNKNDYYFFFKI